MFTSFQVRNCCNTSVHIHTSLPVSMIWLGILATREVATYNRRSLCSFRENLMYTGAIVIQRSALVENNASFWQRNFHLLFCQLRENEVNPKTVFLAYPCKLRSVQKQRYQPLGHRAPSLFGPLDTSFLPGRISHPLTERAFLVHKCF